MNNTIQHEARTLLQQAEQAQSGLITGGQVQSLPEPMQRYLSYVGVVGKEPIRTVRLKQQGVMRQHPGQRWMPLVAEQYFTTKPPAFLWYATTRPFPLVWISATDRFFEGHGTMSIKLCSLIPLVHAHGPEMDQGALVRYLGEIAWFPTAWLTSAITWQAIDASSVKTTIREAGVSASAVLSVNEQGQPTFFTADRYREEHGHYRLIPWSGQYNEYREVDGMRIPTTYEITWHLPSGDFTWLHAEITEIEYNQSGKVTRFSGAQ